MKMISVVVGAKGGPVVVTSDPHAKKIAKEGGYRLARVPIVTDLLAFTPTSEIEPDDVVIEQLVAEHGDSLYCELKEVLGRNLSNSSINSLNDHGIDSVMDLLTITEYMLSEIPKIGKKAVTIIKDYLESSYRLKIGAATKEVAIDWSKG